MPQKTFQNKTQKAKKTPGIKKTILGATTAALVMGAGSSGAQAGHFTDMAKCAWDGATRITSGVRNTVCGAVSLPLSIMTLDGKTAKASAKSFLYGIKGIGEGACQTVLSAAAIPLGLSADTLLWAKDNPKKAAALTIGVAGAVYIAMQNKEQLGNIVNPMMTQAQEVWNNLIYNETGALKPIVAIQNASSIAKTSFFKGMTQLSHDVEELSSELLKQTKSLIDQGYGQKDNTFSDYIQKGFQKAKESLQPVDHAKTDRMVRTAILAPSLAYFAVNIAQAASMGIEAMKDHVAKNFGEGK